MSEFSIDGRCGSCGSGTDSGGNCPNSGCPSKRAPSQFPGERTGRIDDCVAPITLHVTGGDFDVTREPDESIALARLQAVQSRKMGLNRHKGGWRDIRMIRLFSMLIAETRELEEAISAGGASEVIDECADVANFCAFIIDKLMAENPALVEESDDARWVRRIKLLEGRADRATAALRGQNE